MPDTSPYLVEFEDEPILALSVVNDSEMDLPNIIHLTGKEYTDFRTAESNYWDWQRTMKTKYRDRIRAQLESERSSNES